MKIYQSYKPLLAAFFIMFIVLGCASTKPPSWGSLEDGILLSYRSKPGTILQYKSTYNTMTTTERGENSFDNELSKNFQFHLTTEKSDTLLEFILTVDSLTQTLISTAGENAFDFGEIEGKRARLTITPSGDLKEITGVDSIPQGQLPGMNIQSGASRNSAVQLNPGFCRIPDRPLKIGGLWSETRDDTSAMNDTTRGFQRETIHHRNIKTHVIGIENKLDMECIHLRVITDVESETSGQFGETTISGENAGDETSDIWFAYQEGILVEYVSERFSEGTTAYSGQMNMTMPMTSDSKVTLKLIQRLDHK